MNTDARNLDQAILVISNFPDRKSAEAMARVLVEERAAACVNVLPGVTSVYRWNGKMENAREVSVFIKTMSRNYARVERLVREHHPYELPEVVAVPIVHGLPAYLAWVAVETSAEE